MLVSLKACSQYVNLDGLSAEEIANGLTFAGIEVEEVSTLASGTNLVIGHILECENHPDSDHLHVLKVDLGPKFGVEQIVCGAPNARKGLKVIVSRVGAKLPGGEIKAGVIRGVASNGMCCSLLELGVDKKYLNEYQCAGIEELPEDAVIGNEDVLGYLGLDDAILNVKVLANRPDLLSIYNVSREIASIFNREVNIPTYSVKETFNTDLKVDSLTEVCPQFAAREIKDIEVKPSPKWLQESLRAMGIRSINNIVDIGNYVMLLTGQPLHMYDADKLSRKELIVRNDLEGDFVALDENTYSVVKNDIVITTEGKMMCLGGVMGSLACAVDEHSKNIIIEAASFEGKSVRHTSSRLGLSSESSQRFVKGTNHFQSKEVLDFASSLLVNLASAKNVSNIVSVLKEEQKTIVINTTFERINKRLGTEFTNAQIVSTLEKLHFEVTAKGDEFSVVVPSFRLDVENDADISEEVIRILGFDNVKSVLPTLPTTVGSRPIERERLRAIREYLLSQGLDECLTYSLLNKKQSTRFNILNNEEPYVLLNPITDEHEIFRTHILGSLLDVATYNINRQNKNLALFETADMNTKSSRREHLAIVLVGTYNIQGEIKKANFDFYSMKGLVEGIFSTLGIEKSRFRFTRLSEHQDELHPGKSADIIFQNQIVGRFGEIHPNMYHEYDLGKTVAVVLEMDLDSILSAKVSVAKVEAISKFPTVSRDIALVIDRNIMSSELLKTIKTSGKGIVKDAFVFDVYEGNNIANNKKSIAISIIFGDDNRTLVEKEITDAFDKIKFELTKVYQAELRS